MKKLFLFIGVIIWCLLFSCKKDNPPPPPPPPPPPIDSFLLHPPPVLDSLPIPLTIGTWWKYQRIDSSYVYPCFNCVDYNPRNNWTKIDSSIEVITVIGENSIVDTVYDQYGIRIRYDTVNALMHEVKNLTNGILDTIHAFYYNAQFIIKPNKDKFRLIMHLPIAEGTQIVKTPWQVPTLDSINVIKNTSVNVLNQKFDNCIYYYRDYYYFSMSSSQGTDLTTYLKPGIGFVYWEYDYSFSHITGLKDNTWYHRKLIDYHIAP